MKNVLTFMFICISISLLYGSKYEKYENSINELSNILLEKGVPDEWIKKNLSDSRFLIYEKMPDYFGSMAETKVKKAEKTENWYMTHFGVNKKVITGKDFIKKYKNTLEYAEKKHGIPKELITAILGIESNYGDPFFKGKFYTFPALVSQFTLIENRKDYAVNQLVALYLVENKFNKDTYYFIGSFAGAVGWGQFIPESLLKYFITSRPEKVIDIFSIEDNILSIENYFFYNKEISIINNNDIIKSAIFLYNRSSAYVNAVFFIYNHLLEKDTK